MLRQFTGVSISAPKNAAERELDRLGFSRGEIAPGQGHPRADRLLAKYLGPLVEYKIGPLVQSKRYQALEDGVKGEVLRQALAELRKQALAQAVRDDPKLFGLLLLQNRSRRQREAIESVTGQPVESLVR